jgi:Secretion system C-terminal sorting domain
MRKLVLILLVTICFSLIFSQTPTYEFINEPIDLITNYYDYMPGSYNALPIQIEEDGSVYIVFHARETATSTRVIYFAYIDANGNLIDIDMMDSYDIHEGYAGIDLDRVTTDPMVAFHGNFDTATADHEVVMTYDLYHLLNPGSWIAPFIVFADETSSANLPMDEFIWPEVHIGPSPIPDKRRVYVIGKNSDDTPTGSPSENVLIGYADFDENDLNSFSTLDWTYRTIDLLDQWHIGDPEWVRPNLSCSVSDDGQIAFIGYIDTDSQIGNMTEQLIVLHNDNFGEGDFQLYSQEAHYNVWFPGSNDIFFTPFFCHHQNSTFHDNNTKISFLGAMNMMIEPHSYYPNLSLLYPKFFNFDVNSQEFSFYDLYIEGANPSDDTPMIPWDLNEDGVVDSVNANGDLVWVDGWPIYFHTDAFDENNFKITKNEENGWLAAIWNDGLKARNAENAIPGFENWLEKPEIAICISADNGETWSQPIFMNSLETPELADMIPCYVYPGDKIEDLGDDHGKLHLFFLDDYEYGSNFTGGMQKYCSIDIDFGDFTSSPKINVPSVQIELTNYPNPFNPSTKINFQLSDISVEQTVEVSIYNLRGQKVRQFSIFNNQSSIIWNGTDQVGKPVSSGVYFAKLKAGKQIATRKMLLMK